MNWGPFKRRVPTRAEPPPSPIEVQFWKAYLQIRPPSMRGLQQQYKVGRYRIDFALPRYKIGIELDGLSSHGSTEAMARDRARERYLMSEGWYIFRFGGAEVYHDADGCVRTSAMLVDVLKQSRRTWRSPGTG